MLEFLQPLVDAVANAMPALAKKKERDASAKLGAELFLIYVECNEALVLAEDIVSRLETHLERAKRGDRGAPTTGHWISHLVHQQTQNLVGIRNRIQRSSWELQVLDGRASNDLAFLLSTKLSALDALARAIANQRLPLRTAGILIDHEGVVRAPDASFDLFDKYDTLNDELASNSVPMTEPWTPDILTTIRTYLKKRKPRKQLDEIRASMERIRSALEANFTVGDILLRAGDPRAARNQNLRGY